MSSFSSDFWTLINFLCIFFMNYWWVWEVTVKCVNNCIKRTARCLHNIHRFQFPQNNFLGVKPLAKFCFFWLSAFFKHWYITLIFRAVLIHLIKKSCIENYNFVQEIFIGNSIICRDIWHKYHEWYFKIVIRNFTSH